MDRDVRRQWAVPAVIAGGIVSGSVGDYGDAAASVSPVLPVGFAFGIWGPIYTVLSAFAVQQAPPSQRHDPLLARTAWLAGCAMG